MNKRPILFIVGIFSVLAGVLASIPFIDGYIYKNKFINIVTHAHQANMDSSMKLEVQEYKLGWLHSTVKLRLVSTDPSVNQQYPDGIIIDGVVSHGPFVYDTANKKYTFAYANIISKMYLPGNIQKILLPNSPNQPLFDIQTLTTFDGVWSQVISISSLTFPELGKLSFNDIKGKSTFGISGDNLSSVTSTTNIGAISFKSGDENPLVPSIDIQSSQYKLEATKQANNIWNSMSSSDIPSVTVNWPTGKVGSAKNIAASSMRGMNASKLYSADLKLAIAELNIPEATLPNLTKFQFSVEIKDLNPTSIARYMNSTTKENKELFIGDNMPHLQKIWQDTLTPTSKINLHLSFDSPSGALSVVSEAFINPSVDTKKMQLSDLMMNAKMETKVKIAAPLLSLVTKKTIDEMDVRNKRLQLIQKGNSLLSSGSSVVEEKSLNPLQVQVADQLKQGKITLDQSLAIFALSDQKLSTDEFYKKVNVISPDTSTLITQAYQKMMTEKDNAGSPLPGAVQDASSSPTATIEERSQAMIDTWVKQGYLAKVNNDYIIDAIFADGSLMVNGHAYPPAPSVTAPAPSVTAPAPSVTVPAPSVTVPAPSVTAPAPSVPAPVS